LELLLAVAIFSVVLLAINTVFFSALRLRAAAQRSLERAQPLQQTFAQLRQDLMSAIPRGTAMAGDFRVGLVSASSGMAQGLGIEMFTTSGRMTDDQPWPEMQRVIYQLRDPADRQRARGQELIRTVERNLLTSLDVDLEEQFLMSDVESMEIECYSGTDWRSTWDTSLTDTNLPTAIRIKLLPAAEAGQNTRRREPYQLVVPLVVQAPAGTTTTETSQ
jgi:type II secretion system protein J